MRGNERRKTREETEGNKKNKLRVNEGRGKERRKIRERKKEN